jgi:hypothetical protein
LGLAFFFILYYIKCSERLDAPLIQAFAALMDSSPSPPANPAGGFFVGFSLLCFGCHAERSEASHHLRGTTLIHPSPPGKL